MHRLPGWEPHSYGYHGDDGHIYHGEGKGRQYAHPYGSGDVIGVCVDRVQRRVSFYKNGMFCGVAFENLSTAELYPCVGFRSRDARVKVNLGSEPPKCALPLFPSSPIWPWRVHVQQVGQPIWPWRTHVQQVGK